MKEENMLQANMLRAFTILKEMEKREPTEALGLLLEGCYFSLPLALLS